MTKLFLIKIIEIITEMCYNNYTVVTQKTNKSNKEKTT